MKSFFKSIIVRLLTAEAKAVLREHHPRVVAITGTVGKTTTKDAVAAALSAFFSVRKSEKSFNSEIGVPLAILGLPNGWSNPFIWISNVFRGFLLLFSKNYPDWLVLEVGADKPGDISSIGAWLKPDVAIITRFADVPVHIEFFPSIAALKKEKASLVNFVKEDGFLVLGNDDKDVAALGASARGKRAVCFGSKESAEVLGYNYTVSYGKSGFPEGIIFRADINGNSLPISVHGVLGIQHMQSLLAALAVCVGAKLNLVKAAERLASYEPPRGRMRLLRGINDTLIIDDSYNSSPIALAEALVALKSLSCPVGGGRKIAVLGDMLELGEYSVAEHKKGGALAFGACDILYTVGTLAEGFASGARDAGINSEKIAQYRDSRGVGKHLAKILRPGDIVLIKGSQGARMERAVKEILAEPKRAKELLVRQEKEWLTRS